MYQLCIWAESREKRCTENILSDEAEETSTSATSAMLLPYRVRNL